MTPEAAAELTRLRGLVAAREGKPELRANVAWLRRLIAELEETAAIDQKHAAQHAHNAA
jgi:hypothetical protein